jgi:glycosyltransferase involved in cell wall biosynthesis
VADIAEAAAPLISCIVPVFNGERYLEEALDSILAQTYRPLEVIVVDDGSTDGTAGVAARYGERIAYLFQPNAGPAAARNRGLAAARGEFVAFLDADDLWHPEKLARQMARFRARPELDLCVTGVQNFWVPEVIENDERYRDPRNRPPWPGYVCPTLLARREVFEVVGPFNSSLRLSSDDEWFIRAAEHGQVVELLPQVLLHRRFHQSNITLRRANDDFATRLQLVKESLDRRRRGLIRRSGPAHASPDSQTAS